MGTVRKVDNITLLALCIVLYMSATGSNVSAKLLVPPEGIDKEQIMTYEEKVAFDKFKPKVYPHLFREDLKHDLFLLRWLRAKNLNVDVALKDMIGLKNFYIDNNVESINEEDWSDFEISFPFHLGDVHDRKFRPVGYVYLREGWDMRAAILQGKRLRMERYLIKSVFTLMLKVKEAHIQHPNVTQFVILFNLDGFSLIQQGCPVCLQSLVSLLTIYERFLPGFSNEIILVEAPTTWNLFYQVIRPVLSSHTRDVIKLFDTNKKKWKKYIHDRIDPKFLPHYFGGTKNDDQSRK